MKWNYARNNFPLLILCFTLMSADILWRHTDAAQWIAKDITRPLSIGYIIYWLVVGDTTVFCLPQGSLKQEMFNPLKEQQG